MQHRHDFPAVSVLFGNPGKYNIQLNMNLQINTNRGLEQPIRMPQQNFQFGQPAIQYGGHYGQPYYAADNNSYAPKVSLGTFEDSYASLASQPGTISNSWCYHNARPGYPYSSTPIPQNTTAMSSYASSSHNGGCFPSRKCNII